MSKFTDGLFNPISTLLYVDAVISTPFTCSFATISRFLKLCSMDAIVTWIYAGSDTPQCSITSEDGYGNCTFANTGYKLVSGNEWITLDGINTYNASVAHYAVDLNSNIAL